MRACAQLKFTKIFSIAIDSGFPEPTERSLSLKVYLGFRQLIFKDLKAVGMLFINMQSECSHAINRVMHPMWRPDLKRGDHGQS
jgi:hypothetical protein